MLLCLHATCIHGLKKAQIQPMKPNHQRLIINTKTPTVRRFADLVLISLLLTALLGISTLHAQPAIWSGAGTNTGNTNWSYSGNWTGGTPGPVAGIFFYNAGAVGAVSNINNIVDGSTTILSLQYGNTNNFHTTLIKPGVTLTVSNSAAGNLVFVGTGTSVSAAQTVNATVTGPGGSLVVTNPNTASVMLVQQGAANAGAHTAILDLSGLDTFNLTAGRLLLAAASGSGASNLPTATLTLARTNLIRLNGTTAPVLNIADAAGGAGSANTSFLQLGQTNALFANTLTIGRGKALGALRFNPALSGSSPGLYLRGTSATRASALIIGDNSQQTGTSSSSVGTVDLSLGTVDAQVNTCSVAVGQPKALAGQAIGTLTLGAGVFDVNTLNVATLTASIATANVTGTVNVTGTATLVVNTNLFLGINPAAPGTAYANLNITNGAVYANAITAGSGNYQSIITVDHGTLTLTNTAGTIASPLSALNLVSASLGIKNVNSAVTNITATSVTASGTTTITVDSTVGYLGGTMTCPLISYTGSNPFSALTLALGGGYSGYLVDNSGNHRIDLVITDGPLTPPQPPPDWAIWNGDGVANTNWSSSLNWLGGIPGSATNIFFYDLGAVSIAGSINNVVDTTTTVLSLQYGNTNNFHTTLIKPGVTLTVSNSTAVPLLAVGTETDNGNAQTVTATVTGAGGKLSVVDTNAGSLMQVQQGCRTGSGGSQTASLDLFGLDTFNLAAGRLLVGAVPDNGSYPYYFLNGTMTLAKTNVIQLNGTIRPMLNVGDAAGGSGASPGANVLQLGQANSLFLNSMAIGRSKSVGTLRFNPALSGSHPALSLRGTASARVATLIIGDNSPVNTSASSIGTVDLSLGTVDAQVDVCSLATGQFFPSAGQALGTLTLGSGVFDVNTLNVGIVSTNICPAASTGTVNVTGTATLLVNSILALGLAPSDAIATASGTLNITGGSVYANAITAGAGIANSTISVDNGTLILTNTAGAPAAPLSTVSLTGGSLGLVTVGGDLTNLVVNSLTTSGTTLINILDPFLPTGTYTLIGYGGGAIGGSGFGGFHLGTLPAGVTAHLVDTGSAVQLAVTTGTVLVPPTLIGGAMLGSGAFQLTFSGPAGETYQVLSTTNVALPRAAWTVLTNGTFGAGVVTFVDVTATNQPRQFYLITAP